MIRSIASLALASSLLLSATACAQPSDDAGAITADALADDLREWESWLMATHPDPSFSMDVDQVGAQFDAIEDGLEGSYTRRQAWAEFALLNPYFGDGHVGIRLPRDDYDAYLDGGGAAFPVPATFADGRLRVAAAISDASPLNAGDEILAINGEPALDIAAAIFERTHGDSEGLRHYLLETRFSQYLWAITGGANQWSMRTRSQDGQQATIIVDPARDVGDTAPDNWSLAFIEDVALLSVNTFNPALEEAFATFLETAFASIAAAGSDSLIIDISRNGGGAHMLSDRLFDYITTQRHTPLSAVTARITPENQARIPGSEVGEVVSVPFSQWVEPPAELAHRFDGDVVLLVGPGTYSQAIVMAATAQDFGIAPVAGPGTEGRANSTGQVQTRILTHSRLEVGAPIYIFTRASGDNSASPIVPDITLTGSREEQIAELIARLSQD